MGAVVVVIRYPRIQINLQLFNRPVDLAPEGDLVKLLQYRLVKALADTVRLWMTHFRFGVLDVVQREVELKVM